MLVNALRKTNLMIRTLNLPQFLFALLGLAGAQQAQAAVPEAAFVSVMTYNVHGLPWPFASGRDAAFERIEGRLRALRHHNAQPHVVVLQEAFTQGAKAIGTKSGYRYIVNGPSRDSIGNQQAEATDLTFNNAASFFKGETSGKWLDSGLQILSDYPIVSVKRQAFPAFACAGFDCLANKGILLVTIAVPGSATPVLVATTHMNSKRASGVSLERSYYAYQRQADTINHFLAANRNPNAPMVFAGDFNASSDQRKSYLLASAASAAKVQSALQSCLSVSHPCGLSVPQIASFIQKRSRDWQFYANGFHTSIQAVKMQVPFGHERSGEMLSDHIGYGIVYRLSGTLPIAKHRI
jgi:endonuclease/exonuclease/phosphatase family metal-dependent hydrolase